MTFYNTTNLAGAELAASQASAGRQEDEVLRFFRKRPRGMFAPHQVAMSVGGAAPLTSIRRAITNLTTEGRLVKTGIQIPGPYGKPVHLWRLA